MNNSEIAEILNQIATVLEFKNENVFKIRSYQKAALNIERLTENLEDIYKNGGRDALEKIEGIGSGISERIEEIINNGKSLYLKDLQKEIPKGVFEILNLQGVGPKLARKFFEELKIKNIDELKEAALSGKLKKIEGFQDKKVENILRAIKNYNKLDKKHLIAEILPYAEDIVFQLKQKANLSQVYICGSLRRFKETIGDIDLLVVAKKFELVSNVFVALPVVKAVLAKGETKISVLLKNGINADLRIVQKDSLGSAMHYFTGSQQHNIAIRKLAISKGLKVSEWGVFKGNKKIAGETEEEVFASLGLEFIPPELREDFGEIEAAQQDKLPDLVELNQIKGDLHMHSNYTDGSVSIKEMAEAAKKLGYEYIAITDHSKSTTVAGGLDEKKLLKQIDEIDALNKKIRGIKVLKGIEVDILKDGSLDLSNDILKKLDIVIASVHSHFSLPQEEMTARIIKAMQNKYVNIIGHPTGRLIGKRLPYEVDMTKIIEFAKQTNTILELNSFPDRLDINDINCKIAKENNVMVVISTDSHSQNDLNFMKYGVGTARRGWLEKKDVLNTRKFDDLIKILSKKRGN